MSTNFNAASNNVSISVKITSFIAIADDLPILALKFSPPPNRKTRLRFLLRLLLLNLLPFGSVKGILLLIETRSFFKVDMFSKMHGMSLLVTEIGKIRGGKGKLY